jgi:hypothetical protein
MAGPRQLPADCQTAARERSQAVIEGSKSAVELERPRSVGEIVRASLSLLGRFPLQFGTLALAVVAPYELLVLAVAHAAPLGQQSVRPATAFVLFLLDFALVGPLVSALHVHAVVMLGQGRRPQLGVVARRGVRVLPLVAAAQIVAGLGIGLGLLAFVIPGLFLAIGWAVVAQAAAIEGGDWIGALRRSRQLTAGNYLHVLAVLLVAAVVAAGLTAAGSAITGASRGVAEVTLGIALITIVRSFSALTAALLFFDLRARQGDGLRGRSGDGGALA